MRFIATLMMCSSLICPAVIIFLSIKLKKVNQRCKSLQCENTSFLDSLMNGGDE